MNTSVNKAVVALLGGIVTALGAFGVNFDWLPPDWQVTATALITAVLVYMIPNKQA